jgi:hypothetical protein
MKTYSTEHAGLANWLRTQIANGCCRVGLCQRVGAENQHVREWPIAPELDVDGLAEEINGRICEEARVLRGPTVYLLFGFKPGSYDYFDRKIIRMEGIGASPDTLLGETEQPDPRGIVSQMMRHNEASVRISLGQTLAIVEHYKGILGERDARIAALEEKLAQIGELQHELVSMQHEHNLDMVREKRVERKHAFVRDKLDMLAPVLMSKVLGTGTPKGQGSIFGEELLRQFLKSLQPKQYAAITNALNPEQVVTLHTIYEGYSHRETVRQEAAADTESSAGPGDGAANGAADTPEHETNGAPPTEQEPGKEEKK